ncbi:hypothetical protein [Ralstonia solanacearum]|uniref:hypothetical protein n=1 Tax=Ralstonia solanacearum TaxID=305 RepID=UPI00094D07AB|nr:hypothetical protein [Ralstonia solanacearum]OKA46423.1 hypothetical protein BH759_00275 [Ralstonia solanacearum]QOK84653.1 hypothetical protein HF906_21635 [Ralstonia solanacearum]RIJ85213.1 hypothetical protein RSP822_16620 [Ralstonia solanacearum]
MNNEALDTVLDHLHVQAVYPTRIAGEVAPWFDRRQTFDSFTRVNWMTSEVSAAEIQFSNPAGDQVLHLLKFLAKTRTFIVRSGDVSVPGDQEELNESDIVLALNVDFAVEYAVIGCKPEELNPEGMAEFATHNMPYHLWPYYRQTVQDLALRMQVPIPTIPSFRVNKSHQPKKK